MSLFKMLKLTIFAGRTQPLIDETFYNVTGGIFYSPYNKLYYIC